MNHVNILYTAEATATGAGRAGRVRSTDGLIDTDLAVPTDMGGPGGATNPEQLLAAGYAGCFHNALRLVARAPQRPGPSPLIRGSEHRPRSGPSRSA